jgi:hypothetical protein
MFTGIAQLRDADGRPFVLCHYGDIPPHAPETVRAALRSAGALRMKIIIAFSAIHAFIGSIIGVLLGGVSAMIGLGAFMLAFLSMVLMFGTVAYIAKSRATRRAAIRCLAWGICPACGYPLPSSRPANKIRVCPECGRPWFRLKGGDLKSVRHM